MPDDAELLRQYAESGSDDAFAAFVRARVDLVYSAAVRRTGGDAHLAHDVAQRVFCAAAQQAAALARHPHPTAWLYETTRFTASSLMRGERRRKLRERIQGEEAQLTAGADPPWEQLGPLIDEAIDRLGQGDRAAILLRFFDGLAFPEIAQRLALTETGARQRVDRAVEKIRRILARKGITSTAAGLAVALEGQAIGAAPAGLASTLSAGAVSTVVAGGAVAAKSLFFMSTTKAIVTTIALIAIGSTVYQIARTHRTEDALTAATRERDDTKAALAALARERDALAGRLAEGEKQLKELQDQVTAAGRGGRGRAGGQGGRGGGGQGLVSGPLGGPPGMAEIQTLMESPDYRAVQARASQGDLDQRYAALFKNLGLGSTQVAQFKSLLIEKQQAISLAAATADPASGLGDPDTIDRNVQAAQAPVDAQIKATLGDAGYERYQRYEQTVRERATVAQLQQSLSYTATPLSDDQIDRLMPILQQAAPPRGRGLSISINPTTGVSASAANPNGRNATIPITDQVVSAAQAVLSPDQLPALKQLQSQQQAQQQMQQVMRDAGVGGVVGRGAPGP